LFKYLTHTEIVHVPYKGGAAAINDLIAGRVQLMFESLNSIVPFARAGTVRALVVSGARRSPGFPELPAIAEGGRSRRSRHMDRRLIAALSLSTIGRGTPADAITLSPQFTGSALGRSAMSQRGVRPRITLL
jgi:tripartite-type tricarboxylate transporter receptor subunit TctC